jgi:peptidyl-prolyl cis-trans isomerase C
MKRVGTRFSKAAGLEQALKKANLSRARLRLQFKKDIAIRQLLDARVVRTVKVDDLELRAFYDSNPNLFKTPARVKASHIFIKAGPDSTREARKDAVALLNAIRKKLTEGAEFAEMAIDYSQCPTSENGGDLGYFEKEKMIKGFAEAAFGLNPGEISDIVRTRSGYHLIKVTDRQPKTKLAFEDVREKLSRNFKIEKSTHAIKAYLKSLEKSADIKIFIHL